MACGAIAQLLATDWATEICVSLKQSQLEHRLPVSALALWMLSLLLAAASSRVSSRALAATADSRSVSASFSQFSLSSAHMQNAKYIDR